MRVEHWFYTIPLRLRSLFRREDVERELSEELELHLQSQIEQNIRNGMPPDEARYAALRSMQGIEQRKEECRDERRTRAIESFIFDLRYGFRLMRKSPGFTTIAVLTIAGTIGANTAIFSVVKSILLDPLPYRDAGRIVVPATVFKQFNTDRGSVAYPDVLDWRAEKDIFDAVAALTSSDVDLSGAAEPERVHALTVERDYLRVMGAQLHAGRWFAPEEDAPKAPPIVVLAHGLWMRHFGGDRAAVGSHIEIDGRPHLIVGVLREGSTWPEAPELFRPMGFGATPPGWTTRRDNHVFQVMARLRPGVSVESAQARLSVMGARIAREETNRAGTNWKVHGLRPYIVGRPLNATLLILLGAVAVLLLIGCVNIANLLLARSASRDREVAIRSALGAGWQRLIGQFMAESILLGATGGIAGVVVGYWALKVLIRFAPLGIPRLELAEVDLGVIAFTAGLSVLTAVGCGVFPALRAARRAPVEAFREGGRSLTGSLRTGRLRNALVVSEVALAVVLLAGAGLLIRSFARLSHVDAGFPTANLVTLQLGLPESRYGNPQLIAAGYSDITRAVARIPGVVSAAAVSALPLGGGGSYLGRVFLREGQPEPPASSDTRALWSVVQPDYFQTMRIRIVAGRAFTDRDTANSTKTIIISQSMARQMFPNENPLGRRIRSWRDENVYREIVGVASDVRYLGLTAEPMNNVYVPHAQDTWASMMLAVRTNRDPAPLLPSIRAQVRSRDKKLAIARVRTLDASLHDQLSQPRFTAWLLGIFAAAALGLACVGVYGVISYSVAQRTREIGVRIALGATRAKVLRDVAGRALVLAAAGIALGMGAATALTRFMRTLLFGVSPTDLVTFGSVSAVMVLVAFAASLLPARRAMHVHPVEALRNE